MSQTLKIRKPAPAFTANAYVNNSFKKVLY